MLKNACETNLRRTRVLESAVTISFSAVCAGKLGVQCSVRSSASIIASSRVV